MNRKNFIWILVGVGYGIILKIIEIYPFPLSDFHFSIFYDFFPSLVFSVLAVFVGFISRNRYLSFVTILSSFLTGYVIHSLDYRFDTFELILIFIASGVYGINGPISALVSKKVSKQRIASKIFCPNCGRKIERTRDACPYCGMNLGSTRAYDDGTRAYDDGTRAYDDGTRAYDDGTRAYDDGTRAYDS
jgi:hypothetical protein